MPKHFALDSAVATATLLLYAAFGERIRSAVDRTITRRDVYKAGVDAGYERGYTEGRRVARPVVVPIRDLAGEGGR